MRSTIEALVEKALKAERELSGTREGKLVEGVFERLGYLTAEHFHVTNYPRKPLVAFNPSAVLEDDTLKLFVRFVFDYYDYVSSIGVSEVKVDKLERLCCSKLNARLVIYPTTVHEIKRGAEDPRAHKFRDGYLIFYTAVGLRDGDLWPKQGFALLDKNMNVTKKGVLRLGGKFPPSWKNTTMIKDFGREISVLTRPWIEGHEVAWRAKVNIDTWEVDPESMDVVMVPESFEIKVGISTTPVKIGSDEYLVGWHGIMKNDMSYRNGIMVVNGEGEVLGVSEYLLFPQTIEELYGDRPMVIYGCGLVRYKEYIYWIGGIADYGIGVYRAELEELMEHVKWLRG